MIRKRRLAERQACRRSATNSRCYRFALIFFWFLAGFFLSEVTNPGSFRLTSLVSGEGDYLSTQRSVTKNAKLAHISSAACIYITTQFLFSKVRRADSYRQFISRLEPTYGTQFWGFLAQIKTAANKFNKFGVLIFEKFAKITIFISNNLFISAPKLQ